MCCERHGGHVSPAKMKADYWEVVSWTLAYKQQHSSLSLRSPLSFCDSLKHLLSLKTARLPWPTPSAPSGPWLAADCSRSTQAADTLVSRSAQVSSRACGRTALLSAYPYGVALLPLAELVVLHGTGRCNASSPLEAVEAGHVSVRWPIQLRTSCKSSSSQPPSSACHTTPTVHEALSVLPSSSWSRSCERRGRHAAWPYPSSCGTKAGARASRWPAHAADSAMHAARTLVRRVSFCKRWSTLCGL